jgi:hypothetical protein
MTSRLGTGKSISFFYSVAYIPSGGFSALSPPPRASLEFNWGYFIADPPPPPPLPARFISPVSATWGFFGHADGSADCWIITTRLLIQNPCDHRVYTVQSTRLSIRSESVASSPPLWVTGEDTLACRGRGWGTQFLQWVYHNFSTLVIVGRILILWLSFHLHLITIDHLALIYIF